MKNQAWMVCLSAVAMVAFSPGCSTQKALQPGAVYSEWSRRMSELGIFPVFPPREDVAVGDVYALPMHPYDNQLVEHIGGLGKAGIHIGYFNWVDRTNRAGLLSLLSDYYTSRPTFPDTSTSFTLVKTDLEPLNLVRVPRLLHGSDDTRTDTFDARPAIMLRQVAFPEFSVTVANAADLSAMIPVEAISANLGFQYASINRISVRVPQAESYGLPTDMLLQELLAPANGTFAYSGTNLYLNVSPGSYPVISPEGAVMARRMFDGIIARMMNDVGQRMDDKTFKQLKTRLKDEQDCIFLALISEVYFTRAIDINISATKGASGSVAARPMTAAELAAPKQLFTAPTPPAGTTPAPPTGTNGEAPAATNTPAVVSVNTLTLGTNEVVAVLDTLQKRNLNQSIASVGGSVQVMGISSKAIGLRRTFERPVAVGVRGVLLKLRAKPLDGNTLHLRPAGSIWLEVAAEEKF